MTELDYSFNANTDTECMKNIYEFLYFTSMEQYFNKVPFPCEGGRLREAYPTLVFEPEKSTIMNGYIENSFNNDKIDVLVAIKKKEQNQWEVLVL